jgi:hypothetical protein
MCCASAGSSCGGLGGFGARAVRRLGLCRGYAEHERVISDRHAQEPVRRQKFRQESIFPPTGCSHDVGLQNADTCASLPSFPSTNACAPPTTPVTPHPSPTYTTSLDRPCARSRPTADAGAQGGMGSMMQDLAFAIPGVDEAMGFAEIMK